MFFFFCVAAFLCMPLLVTETKEGICVCPICICTVFVKQIESDSWWFEPQPQPGFYRNFKTALLLSLSVSSLFLSTHIPIRLHLFIDFARPWLFLSFYPQFTREILNFSSLTLFFCFVFFITLVSLAVSHLL